MDIDRYKVFYEVAVEKSFSKAAKKLFRTQPAISQSIRQLEEDMEVSLFIRKGKQIDMTREGKILFVRVKEALNALAQAKHEIDGLKKLTHGELIISTSDTIAAYLLPDTLKVFHDRYKGVEIRILNGPSPESAQHVLQYTSDIALITMPFSHPKLTVEMLMTREDVVIFQKDHPLNRKDAVSLSDTLSYPMVLLDKHAHTRQFIDLSFKPYNDKPQIIMELGNIEVIKKLVQKGFGISIVPLITVLDEIKQGTLCFRHLFSPDQCRKIGLVYRTKGILSPAAQVFCELLRELSVAKVLNEG